MTGRVWSTVLLSLWLGGVTLAIQGAEVRADAVNRSLGLPVFLAGESLWEEPAAVVAERVGLRPGSEAGQGRIWRRRGMSLFGLSAEEVRLLEGPEGTPVGLELNLINKGDYFTDSAMRRRLEPTLASGSDGGQAIDLTDPRVRRQLERLFAKDLKARQTAAAKTLGELFGEARGQRFKQAERQRVERWDWRDATFLLDAREDEFVMVRLLPVAKADGGGRSDRRTDRAVKEDLAGNVVRGSQGDVWIRGIPMVDQGEKGYCAVATAERLLRYYGIAVDSHDLADAAQTAKGGGTTWDGMCSVIERMAVRNQRRFRAVGSAMSATSVGRYIDRGMPLIWGLFVTPEVEEAVRSRTAARESVPTREWNQRLKSARREARRLRPDRAGGHLRLIVGYNDQTGEIAYSDSWGDERIYWITEDEARAVSFPGSCLAAVLP